MWRITTPMPGRPPEVHAYLARLDAGWMLVDGGLGTEEAWAALEAGVREAAGGWRSVSVHVVTHMHMDHVGLAARVREASGAPVLMGRLDAERMAHAAAHPDDEAAYRRDLFRRCGAPADWIDAVESGHARARPLAPPVTVDGVLDGEAGDLFGAAGWRFAWTPGHTAGHISLHRPMDGVLIAGDAVLPRITPTLGVNRQRADPVGDYVAALDRLEALGARLILPGHGDPVADGGARIGELRAAAGGETETVAALVDESPATPWELVERRYPGREMGAATRMLALRETLAHLDRLAGAGRVARERGGDGAERFRRMPAG
ncbi:MBL fold metallo-hydrolase [Longimicrobium sp.]|uniref:MBL fold metallo-hydrolase n=1 Tax=Longimicrobium sp. TaxID=2029185 RepID=UPI002BF03327|nr:MBL fold metallo-hydrolase [Longimicrobium sp.]HSU15709.1 MBL fold metallo-hydrolase [Longimicrobium sp.]